MNGLYRSPFRSAFAAALLLAFSAPVWAESSDTEELAQKLHKLEDSIEELDQEIADLKRAAITVQSGTFAIRADGTRPLLDGRRCLDDPKNRRGILNGRTDFSNPFVEPPDVILALNLIDVTGSSPLDTHRLRVVVKSIDQTGFCYQFFTWCSTRVHSASAVLVAHGRTSP